MEENLHRSAKGTELPLVMGFMGNSPVSEAMKFLVKKRSIYLLPGI
jgi:hypothetical protein